MANWDTEHTNSTLNVNDSIRRTTAGRSEVREGAQGEKLFTMKKNLVMGSASEADNTSFRKLVEKERGYSTTDLLAKNGIYDTVGINATQVPIMRAAFRTYVDGVKNFLNGIDATTEAGMAYQSADVQKAVSEYVEKTKKYCMNLVSQLLAFSDKLNEIEKAWNAHSQNLASNIKKTTSNFNAGTEYVDKK